MSLEYAWILAVQATSKRSEEGRSKSRKHRSKDPAGSAAAGAQGKPGASQARLVDPLASPAAQAQPAVADFGGEFPWISQPVGDRPPGLEAAAAAEALQPPIPEAYRSLLPRPQSPPQIEVRPWLFTLPGP